MARCPACGFGLAKGTTLCPQCGQQLTPDDETAEFQADYCAPLDERRLGQYFRTGWQTFIQYPLGFMVFTLITLLVKLSPIYLFKMPYPIGLLLWIAIYPLYVGDYLVSAKLLQKQPVAFVDFFSGFHYYRPLLIYGLILGLIGGIGYLIPTHLTLSLAGKLIHMAFTILYLFTPLIIADRRTGFWQALELSRQNVQRQFLGILIFVLLGYLLVLPGAIAFMIGVRASLSLVAALPLVGGASLAILVAGPVFACATAAAYADLFGLQSKEY
jgi:hypothetical protein